MAEQTPTEAVRDALARAQEAAGAVADLRARSHALADLERIIADAALELGAARVATYRERVAAGETQASIAASEHVSQQRIAHLLAPRPDRDPAEAHRQAIEARNERAHAARDAQTAAWLEQLDTGKATIPELAARAGLSPRTVRERVAAARAARDAAAAAEGGREQDGAPEAL